MMSKISSQNDIFFSDDENNAYEDDDNEKKDDEDEGDINDRELTTDDLTSEPSNPPPVKGRASCKNWNSFLILIVGHVRKEHKADDDIDNLDFKSELTYVEQQKIIE